MPTMGINKKKRNVKQTLLKIALLFLIGMLYTYIAVDNGYPLFTSDSGTYVHNAHRKFGMPLDRPPFYSVFVNFSSLGLSLWLTVFVQGVLCSFLTYRVLKCFLPTLNNKTFIVISLATITLTTVSWFVGQMTPDIFTAIMTLACMAYLFDTNKKYRAVYLIIIGLSALTHNSHFITLLLAAFIIGGLAFFKKNRIFIKKSLVLTTIATACILIIGTCHAIFGYGFTLSPTSHVFLMGSFSESGILKAYLDDHCPNKELKLCAYKDSLPDTGWKYVWEDKGVLQKIGGWYGSKAESQIILNDLALSPSYYPLMGFIIGKQTLSQLTRVKVGDGFASFRQTTGIYNAIDKWYGHELKQYMNTKQVSSKLPVHLANTIYGIVLIVTILLGLLFFLIKGMPSEIKLMFACCILFIVLNAMITANLANVLDRLNARVIWLIPFLSFAYFAQLWLNRKHKNDNNS